MVLICIPPMANEFEHRFGCFLAVCVSCLQHRLFKSALKLGCMLPLLRASHKPRREVPGLPDGALTPSLGASSLTLLWPSRPQSSKPVTVRVLCREVSPTPNCHRILLCIAALGSASERASLFSWSQGPSLTSTHKLFLSPLKVSFGYPF